MKKYFILIQIILFSVNVFSQSPIAYYPFSGNANDAIGSNHGTVNGATLTTDRFGNANSAYSFDGVDDFIGIGSLNFAANDYTISFWVNLNSTTTDNTIFSGADPSVLNNTYIVSELNNGVGRFLHRNPAGNSGGVDLSGVQTLPSNSWKFVSCVKQGTTLTYYVNGQLDNTVTNAAATNISSSIFVELGRLRNSSNSFIRYLNGKLDDLKFYNTSLNAVQVFNDYNSSSNNLVAYYPFNANANDAVGTYHGTVNGATLTTDRFGNANSAYAFDGINDVVELNHAFNGYTELTISAWVKLNGANQANDLQAIVSSDASGQFVHLQTIPGAPSNCAVYLDGNNYILLDHPTPALNTWYQVTLVAKSGASKLYVNGIEVFSDASTFSTISNTNLLRIGSGYQNGRFFNGAIDEVKIYNTALNAAQILADYTPGPSLIASYSFSNNVSDSSGNNLHGTVIGSPTFTTDRNGNANSAMAFNNNVANRIEVDNNVLMHTPNITIAAWVKFNSLGGIKTIVDKPLGGNVSDSWHFGTENGNFSCWHFNSTNTFPYSQAASPINVNQWYYVVNTFDDVSKQHKLYIDGVLKNTVTFNSTIGYDTSKMYIGAAIELGSLDYPMDGAIDEVKIYGEALTAQQIQNTFVNELPLNTKGSGNAISFDGSDDIVNLSNGGGLNGEQSGTVEMWVKWNGTTQPQIGPCGATYGVILSRQSNGEFTNHIIGLDAVDPNTGKIIWRPYDCGNNVITSSTSPGNGWNHLAITFSSGAHKMYLNGLLVGSSAATGTISNNSSIPLSIGAWLGATANCMIDEVRCWNTILTESQIRERMCRKITLNDVLFSNLVAYYNFDEQYGNSVLDGSVNNISGTLINLPSRVSSGAPIGNTSSYSYAGAASSVNHANPSLGDDVTATLTAGAADGIHVYHVNETPNSTAGVSGLENANTYFGTFVVGGTSPTYSISYNYDGISGITNENGLVLATRANNSVTTWNGIVSNLNTTANTLSVSSVNNSQAEYRVAALDPGLVSSSQANCYSYTPNPLSATPAFNNDPATTYQWQDSIVGGTWQNISGATSMGSLVLPLATTTKFYRRLATLSGTTIPSNEITIEAYNAINPSTLPINQWNLYAYDGTNVDSAGVIFKGNYTQNSLGINTITDYGSGNNPSLASGYHGCSLNAPNNMYSLYAKRKGFPSGNYALNIPQHDDEIKIFKDGILVTSAGCCNNMGSQYFTLTTLDANSVIECRMTNSGGGPGHLVVDIFLQNLTGGTIGSYQSNCEAFTPNLLSSLHPAYGGSSTNITYQWQISTDNTNFTDISGETGLTYQPSLVTNDTYLRRKAMNPNNEVAFSNVVHLELTGPTFYADIDGDGYGDPNNFIQACTQPNGYLTDNTDCNDNDTTEHPGQQWYIDNDNDGYCVRDYGFTPIVQCSRPLHGKVLSELIGTPFPSDCDDNDPSINPANQYMTVSGTGNFTNTIVSPLQGSSSTTYYFEALYFDVNNALPPASFPRVFMDYENDGFINGVNDKAILMTEFDANDQTTSDGKKYVASITGLKPGTNWVSFISWDFGANCRRSIGQNAPDVLVLPNLQTFANDITFSNPSPEISSPQTITATVKNQSDFAAQNVVVHLTNQLDTTATYPDITIPNIPANSALNVSWNITTPALLGIVPMQVTVDYTDVIAETNELDNSAVASYNNGNAPVSGGIIVDAHVSPATSYASANNTLTLVFNATFFGTNLPPQLKVAGAPVSFQIVETGTVFTGFTGSDGNINIPFTAPVSPGEYHISGTVTSPPFVGDISPAITKFTLLPGCKADYTVDIDISAGILVEGQSRSIQVTVKNEGCMNATDSSKMVLSIPGAVPDQLIVTIPPLAKNATYSLANPLIVVFPNAGPYSLCAQVDVDAVIDELNETNNQKCRSQNAIANAPDLIVYQGSSGSGPNCDPRDLYAEIQNMGGAASVASVAQVRIKQGNTILHSYTKNIPALIPNAVFSFTESYQPANNGSYEMEIVSDFTNQNTESDENNNVLVTNIEFTPCAPDLIPTNCHVSTSTNDYSSGNMTVNASFENIGVIPTNGPITVRFKFSDNTFHDVIYSNPVQVNEKVDVSAIIPALINPNLTMNIEIDPNNTITEVYETNNEISWLAKTVAWDFFIDDENNPCMVFIGGKKVQVGSMFPVKVPVVNNQLHTADTVKVNYKVSGPGIIGQQDLGTHNAYDVNQGCGACPSIAQLGTFFLFAQEGTYTFTVTVDPDNAYAESNEGNNVLVFDVLAKDDPDMYMESIYINPSLLNPAKGQNITVNVSYANLAKSNLSDQMELKLIIDGVAVDSAQVNGLTEYTYSTHNFTTPWSSTLAGVHVIKAIIDSDSEIDEVEEDNNEATRAITVGSSANLKFNELSTLNVNPALNDSTTIKSIIQNEGDLATNAVVEYYYVNNNLDTILINALSISVPSNDSIHRTFKWKVVDNRTTIIAKIKNSTTLEFNYNDNGATLELGSLKVYTESLPACLANNQGMLTAHVIGGELPYNYSWSNGSINQQMQDIAGNYSLTVVDFTGQQVTVTDSIPTCQGGILNVKSYIQGFYQGGGLMSPVLLQIGKLAPSTYTDTIEISLCDTISGNPVIFSTKAILHTNGTINCHFPFSELGASRYIVLKHRNSLETWSAVSVTISNNMFYDFSIANSQAFGNNQIELESGKFALYSGDMDQNGYLELDDYNIWDLEYQNGFPHSNYAPDLDGNGYVELDDYNIWDLNYQNGVFSIKP